METSILSMAYVLLPSMGYGTQFIPASMSFLMAETWIREKRAKVFDGECSDEGELRFTEKHWSNQVSSGCHRFYFFYSFDRKHRAAIFFFYSDDDIPASHIVDVIGKSADCPNYFIGTIVCSILNPY